MSLTVLQAMGGGGLGGAETYFADLTIALHRAGLEQILAVRKGAAVLPRLRAAGLDPVELPFGGVFDWRTGLALRRLIRERRPQIVQTWMNRATRFAPRGDFVHVGWLGGYYAPANFRRCDHVVGVTPGIVRHLREAGWPEERSRVLRTFAPFGGGAAPLPRAAFDTPADAPLVVALGRLHPKKGFDVLLRAMADLPQAWLWLAGEGPLRAELEAQARDLGVAGRVRFLGWRDDREAVLASGDLCAFPSRYEPFGTVTLEAWAAGKPLVVAAAAGPKETVRDGEDALLAPVDDAAALAAAMRRVLEDRGLAARLVDAGRARIAAEFSEAAVTQAYLDFYASLGADAEAKAPGSTPASP